MTSEFDTEESLENERDFLDSRIKVLAKKAPHSLWKIAGRKGIELGEATRSDDIARIIAHAEAEKIGLLGARPTLSDQPGPLLSEHIGEAILRSGWAEDPGNIVTQNGAPDWHQQVVDKVEKLKRTIAGQEDFWPALVEDEDGAPLPFGEQPPRNLPGEIMAGWIGAVGGMDWYNGPTSGAERARQHGSALAATLDAVFDELPLAMRENPYQIGTTSGWFIYEVILPEVLRHFFTKNAGYGDQHRYGLGPAAEWVGIDRKIHKLERVLWEGEPVSGPEHVEEMLYDLIGQCFIILDLLAGNHNPRGRGPVG